MGQGVHTALPMLVAASHPATGLRWHDAIGIVVWLIAVAGEATADIRGCGAVHAAQAARNKEAAASLAS